MYELNSKVQVLDRTNVWRNGLIIARSNGLFTIRFENGLNSIIKIENDYTSDMVRLCVEERIIPKNNLKVDFNELSNLIVDDKIFFKASNENRAGTVLHNDPFYGKIRIEENHEDVNYEQIYSTTKSNDPKKRKTQISNEISLNTKRKRLDQIFSSNNASKKQIENDERSESDLNEIDFQQKKEKFDSKVVDRLIYTIKDGFKSVNQTLSTIATSVNTLSLTIEKIYQQQMSQQLVLQQQSLQLLQYQQEIRELIHNQNNPIGTENNQESNLGMSNYDSASNESLDELDFDLRSNDIEEKIETFTNNWSKESDNIEYCTKSQIRDLVNKSKYGHLFAAHLMEKIFSQDEFDGCNVYGKGEKHMNKKALDPKRVRYIEKITNEIYNKKFPKDHKFWPKCVIQMNRRIIQINKNNGKL